MKHCRKCDGEKPLDAFARHRGRPDGRQAYCKECHAQDMRRRRLAHPKRAAEQRRRGYIRHTYGITVEEYEARMDRGCAICGARAPERKMHLDHDHETGALRDTLCGPCNAAIGMFDEDTERLAAAVAYLEKWDRAGGQTLPGLTKRRAAEVQLATKGDYSGAP